MKKSTKIILPALALLVLGTTAAATSTVAWFAANGTVSAEGMKVQCTTSENLVISNVAPKSLASGSYGKIVSSKNTDVATLNPSSTIKSKFEHGNPTFYQVSGEKIDAANGQILENAVIVEGEAGGTSKAYAKHEFWLSAQSLSDMDLRIESVEFTTPLNNYISQALRMGIHYVNNEALDNDGPVKAENIDSTTGEVKGGTPVFEIFKLGENSDSSYLGLSGAGTVTAITKDQTQKITSIKAGDAEITATVTPVAPTNYDLKGILTTKAATADMSTQYWSKVSLYFWYEGQDSHCTAMNALSVQEIGVKVNFTATSRGGAGQQTPSQGQ